MSGYRSIADVRRANKALGHHFFERGTMRFFASIIEPGLYGGRYFVTSERGPVNGDVRRYTVREALDSGAVETRGEFQEHRTLEDARAAARELAAEVRK